MGLARWILSSFIFIVNFNVVDHFICFFLRIGITDEEYDTVFKSADLNNDGKICIEEFIHHLTMDPIHRKSEQNIFQKTTSIQEKEQEVPPI